MSRIFGPKISTHPTIGILCPACAVAFAEGCYTVLVPLGPGDDQEAQAAHRDGRAYNAGAVEVHAACAGRGEEVGE